MTVIGEAAPVMGAMEPKDAVVRAIDQDALLDGEDPTSPHLEDADHWISVYRELIDFKESLLNSSQEDAAQLEHPEARTEATHVDGTILLAELERFRRRLEFWKQRQEQLSERAGF